MRECPRCGGEVEGSFRYCPWCAQPQRLKLVEFFASHPRMGGDRGRALRVSRYLAPVLDDRHVRFSVWHAQAEGAAAEAAVSLDDREAHRLARFLLDSAPRHRTPRGRSRILEHVRLYARALR